MRACAITPRAREKKKKERGREKQRESSSGRTMIDGGARNFFLKEKEGVVAESDIHTLNNVWVISFHVESSICTHTRARAKA